MLTFQSSPLQTLPATALPTPEESLQAHLPACDQDAYLRIKTDPRHGIYHKIHAVACIDVLIAEGFTQKQSINEVIHRKNGIRGLSASMLAKTYPLWKYGGQKPNKQGKPAGTMFPPRCWKLFAANYHNGRTGQPEAFKEFVVNLHTDTSRDDAFEGTRARLLDLWRCGTCIPGYGTIHDWCEANGRPVPTGMILRPSDYPDGWSTDNLRRFVTERSKPAIQILRKGEYLAHKHWSDQLLRDRANLMPLQLITFDDVRFDIRVLMWDGNQARAVYPLGLFCLDVATGMILSHGIKASDIRDEDEGGRKAGTRRALNKDDTRFQMLQLIETLGVPPYKMRVLLENATASLTTRDKDAFLGLMPGRIEFEETGMIHRKLLKSGFRQEGGMPWQKGWIEAWFRGLHTRINHLPNTQGRRYDLTPSDAVHRERYAIQTIKDALERGIDPAELRLPVLSLDQFKTFIGEYVNRINWRVNHRLQGFGNIYEYELRPGNYIRFDDPQQSHLIPVGANLLERREAPAERLARLLEGIQLKRPRPEALLPLYLDKREVTIRNERIQFTDKKYGNDALVYRDDESRSLLTELDGRKVRAFVREDLELIHLTDLDYAYLGSIRRYNRRDLADDRDMELGIRAVHRARETVRAEARQIAQPQEMALAAERAHNDALLLGDQMSAANAAVEISQDLTPSRDQLAKSFKHKKQPAVAADDWI